MKDEEMTLEDIFLQLTRNTETEDTDGAEVVDETPADVATEVIAEAAESDAIEEETEGGKEE